MLEDYFLLPVLGVFECGQPHEVLSLVFGSKHRFDVPASVLSEVQHEVIGFAFWHVHDVAVAFDAIGCCVDTSLTHGCVLADCSAAFTGKFHMFQFGMGRNYQIGSIPPSIVENFSMST